MRVCDRCGTKQAPYQPRTRVGDELLCGACKKAPPGVSAGGVISEAAKKPSRAKVDIEALSPEQRMDPTLFEESTPDYPVGHGMAGGDDDWGMPQEGVHGLQQPLPNSVWENYARARNHKGEPLLSRKASRDLKVPYRSLTKQVILDRWRQREETLRRQAHVIEDSSGNEAHHTHAIPNQMLPPTSGKHDVLEHLGKHHPEVSAQDYDQSAFKSHEGGFLKGWHDHLHDQAAVDAGYHPTDAHQHEGPKLLEKPGDIDMMDHVEGHHHGWLPFVAKEEAAKHHQLEHDQGKDEEVGHSHEYVGGPPVAPITALVNPHHAMFHPGTPAVMEWYHGTPREYEGPPQTTTENYNQGNDTGYGSGDWNCHVGSHWSSLHQMADEFHGNSRRVIHARLKIKNPKVYDNLNHMAHDAYERLYAQGEFQDSPYDRHHDSHEDDSGYNECCSKTLLGYAKGGGGRDDGQYGLQRYRDSLRADGHDGILVRNQADSPSGHWNAMALSPHQIEVTDAHCPKGHDHGDARTKDKIEFNDNHDMVMEQPDGSTWEKGYNRYERPDELPDRDKVDGIHEGKSPGEAHHGDPDYPGDWSDGDEGDEGQWCDYCEEHGNHEESDHWEYCNVCEEDSEHGHSPEDAHPHCEWCDDYADHESDDHEDEWGDKPDDYRPEDYCPHCGDFDKQNRDESNCVNCDEQLPDWGQIKTKGMPHGEPINPQEAATISKEPFGGNANAPEHSPNASWLKSHLDMHHGSDTEFSGWENGQGSIDQDAMNEHHKWLHMGGDAVAQAGYDVDHDHKAFATHKAHDDMSEADFLAHMAVHHTNVIINQGDNKQVDYLKQQHDRIHSQPWGVAGNGDIVGNTPNHNHEGEHQSPGAVANAPILSAHPDDLLGHFIGYHTTSGNLMEKVLGKDSNPEHSQAVHSALHQIMGSTGTEWQKHEHDEDGEAKFTPKGVYELSSKDDPDEAEKQKHAQLLQHLAQTHGAGVTAQKSYEALSIIHDDHHASNQSLVAHDPSDHGKHEIPDELGEGVKNWMLGEQGAGGGYKNNDADMLHDHLSEGHGYDGPIPSSNQAKHEIHKHFHDNPGNLPKGMQPADHQHELSQAYGHYNAAGKLSQVNEEGDGGEEFYGKGDTTNSVVNHLDTAHPDLKLEHPDPKGDHGMNDHQYKDYLLKAHDEHHAQKAADPQTPGFHSHEPDPDPPQFPDDPTKNDDLVKHMMNHHNIHSSKLADVSHEEMVKNHLEHHLGAKEGGGESTTAETAKAPLDKHTHSYEHMTQLMHSHPASHGLPGLLPVANDHTEVSEHLASYHDEDQEGHENKTKEELQALHAQHHANPEHEDDHTHLGPVNSPHEYDKGKMDHLYQHHGVYANEMHAMPMEHWDAVHAHLHGDGSKPLAKDGHPTMQGKPIGHHHE